MWLPYCYISISCFWIDIDPGLQNVHASSWKDKDPILQISISWFWIAIDPIFNISETHSPDLQDFVGPWSFLNVGNVRFDFTMF